MRSHWGYILAMFVVTYLIRVLPLTLFRREIKNKTVRSFLYYVPFITLAAMTFPDILHVTESIFPGLAALIAGCVIAFLGGGLPTVAIASVLIVFVLDLFC